MKTPLQSQTVCVKPRRVNFEFNRLKIEHLVGYFNEGVIDLTPPYQRGRVWNPKMRRELLKNIFQGKPIPAIFWYKTQEGAKNVYVILDGKQRLESLLLYIGDQRKELSIPNWHSYIFGDDRRQKHFKVLIGGKKKNLRELSDEETAKFRDYSLCTIEIDFDDEVTLAEIIQLFVDINQSGVKVGKFDIVKAVYLKDPLLNQIFTLIAEKQKRGKDTLFRLKDTSFSKVLKKLDIVSRGDDPQSRVDIMWQKLWELALYAATGQHRKPSQILKDFISRKGARPSDPKLSPAQIRLMGNAFRFLADAYKNFKLRDTRLATDQTHFYILATYLIDELRQILPQNAGGVLTPALAGKIVKFEALVFGKYRDGVSPKIIKDSKKYIDLSAKQTTDASKRQEREILFREILKSL
jgi:Protein of unknown function DUF262